MRTLRAVVGEQGVTDVWVGSTLWRAEARGGEPGARLDPARANDELPWESVD